MTKPKILFLEEVIDGEVKKVAVCHFIRREERIIWEAWEQLISYGLQNAAANTRGLFRFQLLDIDLKKGHQSFNPQNFAQLVVNRSKLLKPGSETNIVYTSLVGMLKLKVDTSWGKIDFDHGIQTFLDQPEKLDLFLKKVLASTDELNVARIDCCDLSAQPVLEPENSEQRSRLINWLQSLSPEKSALLHMEAGGQTFQLNELLTHSNGGE